MLHDTIPVLFESTAHLAVVQNPVNADWVALIDAIGGERFETLARRYYVGLSHFRKQRARPALPGQSLCGFLGRHVMKQPGELTSRRLPSLSVCEEFSEVMTRYGLWHFARVDQVRHNIATGVVEVENTACFDTTHVESNSHCDNVVPINAQAEEGEQPKHRKVPRMRKR